MCNLSTNFDKENGTIEAGSHKKRKIKQKRSWQKQYVVSFANSSFKYLSTIISVLISRKKMAETVDHSTLGDNIV